jgi:hypothetical protein
VHTIFWLAGNIEADAEGKAEFHLEDRHVKLIGPHSVIGRSVVLKANEDDLGRVSDIMSDSYFTSSVDTRNSHRDASVVTSESKLAHRGVRSEELMCATLRSIDIDWKTSCLFFVCYLNEWQGGHELSLTTGNAGPRIAGGVVGIAQS